MHTRVVVAVDGSQESLRAVEWAAFEAERRGAPLRIVAAPGLPPRMRVQAASAVTVANALRGIAARGLAAAVERAAEIAPSVAVDTDLLDGPPAQSVTASAAGAQLLVVGARGTGGFAALTLGSVSRHVASHAPCPAVVVREEADAVYQEIVVGVRDPDDACPALGFAIEEAAVRHARLLAVHAIHLPSTGPVASEVTRAAVDDVVAEAAGRLGSAVAAWAHKYPEVDVRSDVVRSHPAHVLASLSARADLVVIGRHDAASGPGSSSIQHAVLGHARGPVAVVPSDLPA